MSGWLTLLLIGAIDPPKIDPPKVHRYVVAVGYNRSANPKMEPLRYADDDAARWFELLSPGAQQAHLLVWFDERSSKIYKDLLPQARKPTKRAFSAAFEAIAERLAADHFKGIKTELYFFYAGHGDERDGVGYFNLADGLLTRPEFRALLLEGQRADKTHVIIDACKSYFMISGRGPGGRREPRKELLIGPDDVQDVGLILSTSDESQSHEWAAFASGIFSHEVRSGLLGAADVDGDGRVTYLELQAFIAVTNRAVPEGFKPKVFIRAPKTEVQGEASVVFEPGASAGAFVEIDLPSEGRVTIYDDRNVRYADAHKSDRALRLLLGGRAKYDVRFRARKNVGVQLAFEPTLNYVISPRGQAVQLSQVEASPYDPPRGDVRHDAFERVFERPFKPSFYDGFHEGLNSRLIQEGVAIKPETNYWIPGLTGGGLSMVVVSGLLAGISLDARAKIDDTTNQRDRVRQLVRAQGLAIGAGAGFSLAISALAGALYLYLSQD